MMKRRPSRLPEANWDWTNPEEVCKNALAAFYGASRHTAAQHAQDPENRAFPDQFIREVTEAFQLRLQTAAHFAGIPGFEWAPTASDTWFHTLDNPASKIADIPCGQSSPDIHCRAYS